MTRLNPEWVEFVLPIANASPYFANQKMKVINLIYGESFLEVSIKRKHLQAYGSVHGGVCAALIDACGWWAVYTQVEDNMNAATAEMKLNYLSNAKEGKLIAHGRCIKLGKKLGLAEASIKSETGKLIAHGMVTVMKTSHFSSSLAEKIPLKFTPE